MNRFGSLLIPSCYCCKESKYYWGFCIQCKYPFCNDCGEAELSLESTELRGLICNSCTHKAQYLKECCVRRLRIELGEYRRKELLQSNLFNLK